jgi:hypothetical protein
MSVVCKSNNRRQTVQSVRLYHLLQLSPSSWKNTSYKIDKYNLLVKRGFVFRAIELLRHFSKLRKATKTCCKGDLPPLTPLGTGSSAVSGSTPAFCAT